MTVRLACRMLFGCFSDVLSDVVSDFCSDICSACVADVISDDMSACVSDVIPYDIFVALWEAFYIEHGRFDIAQLVHHTDFKIQ